MKFLRHINEQIVWQEVPGETALSFTITGCPLRCKGCHSSEYRNPKMGEPLLADYFQTRLEQYRGLITCVLFLGGEWLPHLLQPFLEQAQRGQLNTCLYSGFNRVPNSLLNHLTYLKTGPWITARGGLDCPDTNQRFIDLRTNEVLNYKFQRTGTEQLQTVKLIFNQP